MQNYRNWKILKIVKNVKHTGKTERCLPHDAIASIPKRRFHGSTVAASDAERELRIKRLKKDKKKVERTLSENKKRH